MAAVVVGGAFLGAAFNVLLDRLSSPELNRFFASQKHEEKLKKTLHLRLSELAVVLDDAEMKQLTNPTVKAWLDELKDAIYDAEDLVDEIGYEAKRCEVKVNSQSGLNQVLSPISSITKLFNKKRESKLQMMIDRLEEFTKGINTLGLRPVDQPERYRSQTRLTDSVVVESDVYGREDDKEEIMKLLLSDGEGGNNFDVIPIVGMGGLGKTTLAQLLYNDGRIDEHFVKKAWVCVSDLIDFERLRITIVEQVTGSPCHSKDTNFLASKLKESLSGIKFLIVLDDVWHKNYEDWDHLMTPLKFGARGSKIIVTTRDEGVASKMPSSVSIHSLRELPEEHCRELFSKHAFERGDQDSHPNLVRIGEEIVKKCKGLPLAAKILGGLLSFKRDLEGWNDILKSDIWDLPEGESNILPALRLSYHYLPSHLKRCFASCSVLPKDYKFDMKELVSIWVAEGFLVKPRNNEPVEEEGYKCFRELLSRSFFQRSNAKRNIYQRSNAVSSLFVMHDLVHDLAEYVMGDFYYRLEGGNPRNVPDKVRYFSYHFEHLGEFEGITEAKCLRTFLPLKHTIYERINRMRRGEMRPMKVNDVFPRSTRLRMLSFSNIVLKGSIRAIGNLIHLCFLDISGTRTKKLPESICTLYNLETLLLADNPDLKTLPTDFVNLISLRHLDLNNTNLKEMPKHMSRLKGLQELTVFVVGKRTGLGINELREFHCLQGTISILGLQNVNSSDETLEAKMMEKRHLEKLVLKWGTSGSKNKDLEKMKDVLEKLQPHANLKQLQINNYGGTKFPTWLGDESFCNMVSLHLENCQNCVSLPPLGQMPSLKAVIIRSMSGIVSVGPEFYGPKFYREGDPSRKPFQSLETLRFVNMSGWEEWCTFDVGEFSQLRRFEVINCPKLILRLPRMPSLVDLQIRGCQELEEMSHFYMSLVTLHVFRCKRVRPIQLGLFPKLRSLKISGGENFEKLLIPDGIVPFSLPFLKHIYISSCPNILSFPCEGLHAKKLSSLSLHDCEKLKAFPEQMHNLLPSLQSLSLINCPKIESFPEGGLPSKLDSLDIRNCKKLVGGRRGWGLQTLPSLKSFTLEGESEDVLESFPEEGLLPCTLTTLYLRYLPSLESLGRGLQLLGSLQLMSIKGCPKLQSLSVEKLPDSLTRLEIYGCPLLEPRLREGGEDWPKIRHISDIRICVM